ncbi:uncharacterized protein LOC128244767 isoform X1 [Mya arenaria]|uniref:uncharacterized protein LOC128244767 isoform X1 n=1 Tax=Mya arenaria TaxID=6604 RepID=UPI0022E7D79D|nr:uncharacterized protein LOC128244767 isoform X1 [Mya arenaria]XP_052818795.1 uncharacterized protein LOC128244767 isoform X1 [Mya arenaria]XP_052818797.1 uncharacterized protein LOC128244767 isoform X1 [Mya arenaria]XP_052818798.1 uncharacterized protein LOC128244767 isoform X1 [Mya arenaria]XP_052818799.1 uncharacterized protein LOC128244767 isoform X1 [Mya arenaria]XP_052818800.1 uncharacterized protein LOC128244767 isoform X1 [Mya arenaria]XP_052818801.1 uncharacterized protein LOC12824
MKYFNKISSRFILLQCVIFILICYWIFISDGGIIFKNSSSHGIKAEYFETVDKKHSANGKILLSRLSESNFQAAKKHFRYFTEDFKTENERVKGWMKDEVQLCGGRIKIYASEYGIARGITMFPGNRPKVNQQPKGGEEVRKVLGQAEELETYQFGSNFWVCNFNKTENFGNTGDFYWNNKITIKRQQSPLNVSKNTEKNYVVGVRRQDYANLHNWVRNIYNIFLIMVHFRLQPSEVSILFLDGHPYTPLDNAWAKIFSEPVRVGHLSEPVYYENFIWGFQENKGLITEFEAGNVPYLEEFRSFVLSRFDIPQQDHLDCSNLQLTLILRRNAIYHPRNAEGKVTRKIFNEAEIVETLQKTFPTANVQVVLMEALPMKSQIEISSKTDIWIGMHGAGMSHVTFLPKHAAVLELFQKDFKVERPWFICFQSITKWRDMKYDTWENMDTEFEMPSDFTVVPPDVIANKTTNLANQICDNNLMN